MRLLDSAVATVCVSKTECFLRKVLSSAFARAGFYSARSRQGEIGMIFVHAGKSGRRARSGNAQDRLQNGISLTRKVQRCCFANSYA